MLDYSDLEKYDPSKLHKVYDEWPQLARKSYESNLEPIIFDDIDHIVFAGMGGSGAVGNIFSSILSKENIHVNVTKGYLLPKTVDSKTLVVATSISGNTIETLTVLDSAAKSNCKTIAFSSGGKIEQYCKQNRIEYRKIPQIHSPRASFTNFLFGMLKVLKPILPLEKNYIDESITSLEKLKNLITSNNLNLTNPSLKLAEWISEIPIIYYPHGFHSAAVRFKNSLQENSKIHAMTEDIVEASHNGIVSWEKPSVVQPILLEGIDDYVKTKELWIILKDYFEENKIEYREVYSVNGHILTKLITLIYLLDYSTIYQAVMSKTDPSPVNSIDYIKNNVNNLKL